MHWSFHVFRLVVGVMSKQILLSAAQITYFLTCFFIALHPYRFIKAKQGTVGGLISCPLLEEDIIDQQRPGVPLPRRPGHLLQPVAEVQPLAVLQAVVVTKVRSQHHARRDVRDQVHPPAACIVSLAWKIEKVIQKLSNFT